MNKIQKFPAPTTLRKVCAELSAKYDRKQVAAYKRAWRKNGMGLDSLQYRTMHSWECDFIDFVNGK